MTDNARIKLVIEYDPEANVWFTSKSSVRGAVYEAESLEKLGYYLDYGLPILAKDNKDRAACAALGIELEDGE